MRLAIASDPLDPLWPAWLAVLCLDQDLVNDAAAAARHAIEVNPNFALGWGMLAASFTAKGMIDSALAILEPLAANEPDARGPLSWTYVSAGRLDEARRLAADLEATGRPAQNQWFLPLLYASLGEREQALSWMERAFERPHPWAPWLLTDRRTASLRAEPRFQALVERLDLPK